MKWAGFVPERSNSGQTFSRLRKVAEKRELCGVIQVLKVPEKVTFIESKTFRKNNQLLDKALNEELTWRRLWNTSGWSKRPQTEESGRWGKQAWWRRWRRWPTDTAAWTSSETLTLEECAGRRRIFMQGNRFFKAQRFLLLLPGRWCWYLLRIGSGSVLKEWRQRTCGDHNKRVT